MAVNKEKFQAYVTVQESGDTNMFDIKKVIELADKYCYVELNREDCLYIMKEYGKLKIHYKEQ